MIGLELWIQEEEKKQSLEEELQDTKGVVRIRKSKKGRQHNDKKKKGHKTIYKTLHMSLEINGNTQLTKNRGELFLSKYENVAL